MNIMVDTIPSDSRGKDRINVGLEIASMVFDAKKIHFSEDVPIGLNVKWIGFNVFYPMHIFNVVSFLRRNNIPLLSCDRKKGHYPRIVAGGQGIPRMLHPIMDEIYYGEADGDHVDRLGHSRASEITSPIFRTKSGKEGFMELTRGCKYRCGFCEYAYVGGGKYRERSLSNFTDIITP